MIIYIAHNGKKVEVQAQASTSVDAVQRRLATIIGTPVSEQILIVNGTPLDPRQTLGAYKLPADVEGKEDYVFLYNKAHLRSSAAPPEPETLRPIVVKLPQAGLVPYEAHLLDAAASPLVAALPQYERSFRDHLLAGRAYWDTIQERLEEAARMAEEMWVQAAAIEAARGNVEHHYNYICAHFQDFIAGYSEQRRKHAEVLGRFERDMEALASMEIPAQARTAEMSRLSDLVPGQRMRDWAAQCASSHQNLSDKVGDVESVYNALKADVEALFMTAPSVNLDGVEQGLRDTQARVHEEESILAVLTSDYGQVQKLVEDAVRQLSAAAASSAVTPLDKCQLMEQMNDNHVSQLLPRLRACDEQVAAFTQRCLHDKNQMMGDVLAHLRAISGQQSKIRGLRSKLAILKEAAAKQESATSELLLVRRIPAVYRQCLAECMRREAFGELYAGQAGQMAERMGRLRAKEVAKRDAFLKHVERYLPAPLLAGLGLLSQPPHCQISVPMSEGGLLKATMDDIRAVPISLTASGHPSAAAATPRAHVHAAASQTEPAETGEAEGEGEPDLAPPPAKSLDMENARLRAEIATLYAMDAARAMAGETAPLQTAPSLSASQRSGQLGSEAGSALGDGAAAARFRSALAAKEDVEHRLETELAAARAQAASYEHRIRQLEGRLLRSVVRTSPSGSLRFSMRSSGSGSTHSAGSLQLPPVSEAPEGSSQETVSKHLQSSSSPVLSRRSPGSSTEALHAATPARPDQGKHKAAIAPAVQPQPQRAQDAPEQATAAQRGGGEKEQPQQQEQQQVVQQAAPKEQQPQPRDIQQMTEGLESLEVHKGGAVAKALEAEGSAAPAAAPGVVRTATPFAAAAQQQPKAETAAAAAAGASEGAEAPSDESSGEQPPPAAQAAAAAAVARELSRGGSVLPFAPSAASAISEAPSLGVPSAPPAAFAGAAAAAVPPPVSEGPPGSPTAATAAAAAATADPAPKDEDVAAATEEAGSAPLQEAEGEEASPASLSHSRASSEPEQW